MVRDHYIGKKVFVGGEVLEPGGRDKGGVSLESLHSHKRTPPLVFATPSPTVLLYCCLMKGEDTFETNSQLKLNSFNSHHFQAKVLNTNFLLKALGLLFLKKIPNLSWIVL